MEKHNITVIIFNEDKPYINSNIEPKINIHSKLYTACLYSEV